MRSEHECKCPKCGYWWIDVSEGYFIEKNRLKAKSIADECRAKGKYCEKHQIGYKVVNCPMCIKEDDMNKN